MAKNKNNSDDTENISGEARQKMNKSYEQLIDRLKKERKELQHELNNEYREARRYVRSHPEEGVLIGFVGGIALGFLLGKLTR